MIHWLMAEDALEVDVAAVEEAALLVLGDVEAGGESRSHRPARAADQQEGRGKLAWKDQTVQAGNSQGANENSSEGL